MRKPLGRRFIAGSRSVLAVAAVSLALISSAGCSCSHKPPTAPQVNDLNVILVDSNSPVEERREAAKLLGEHGIGPNAPRAVVGLLIAARNDGDLQVRLLALQSIRWLAPALGPSGPDAVIPELKEIQEQERHSGVQAFIDEVIKAYEAQRPEEPSEATPPE